jgi:hypothetical protein
MRVWVVIGVVLAGLAPGPVAAAQAGATSTPAEGRPAVVVARQAFPPDGLVRLDGPQSLVAFTWVGDEDAVLRYRVELVDGTWSGWSEVVGEEGDPEMTRAGTMGVAAPGAFDAVEVHAVDGEVRDLEVVARPLTSVAGREAVVGATPAIHPRRDWTTAGWRCSGGPAVSPSLHYVVVHHTVNPPGNDYTAAQVPSLIEFDRSYQVARGACDLEYNAIVDKYGGIWEGRLGGITNVVRSGGTAGFPTSNFNVALLGQHDPDPEPAPDFEVPAGAPPTAAEVRSLVVLIAWQAELHGLDLAGRTTETSTGNRRFTAGQVVTFPTLVGHRDLQITECPGTYAYDLLPGIRTDALTIVAADRLASSQYDNGRVASRLYHAAFVRLPDYDGLQYWRTQLDQHRVTAAQVASSFVASPEFQATYGALDDTAFVDLVYRNVLGRTPDAGGEAYWVGQLRTGARTRGGVILGFSESAEHQQQQARSVGIQLAYVDLLRRMPSADDVAWWSSLLASGLTYADFLHEVIASPEFAAVHA